MKLEDKINENEVGEKVIDCTIDPIVPSGLELVNHHDHLGKIRWNPTRIKLLKLDPLAESSYKNVSVKDEMRAALADDPTLIPEMWKSGSDLLRDVNNKAFRNGCLPLPANVLDYLLENLNDIPSDWRNKNIIFTGSLYKGYDKNHYSSLMARSLKRNPIHKIKEMVQEHKNPFYRFMLYTIWLAAIPLNLACGFGFSEFVEYRFQFDDSLRYLTEEYVPVYSDRE